MDSASDSGWVSFLSTVPAGRLTRPLGERLVKMRISAWGNDDDGDALESYVRSLLDLDGVSLPPGGRRTMHRFLPRLGEAIIEDIGEADSVPFAPVAERTFAVLEEINDIISPRCAPAASSLRGTQLRAREPHEEFSAWMEAQSYEEIIASVGVGYHRYAFVQGPP